ncbi:rhodanese-like domain-containing protein [uncultured Thiothrix sp.]|uniref:rhodanese-like domain-containing protein n=1 Tax=uncultured Thiothrix sp. TaxID=223185 RepID=UPI00261CA53B|nr:rhodanese-like domain-containing protein [uncultured Thiothrix sp.]
MSITANPSAPVSQTIVKGAAHSVPAVFPAQTTIQTTSDLGYAGIVSPTQAWELFQAGTAVIVDVRSKEELHFVGRVPGTLHVAWATGTALNRNPRFVRELEAKLNKSQTILLLCRSGKRSAEAAIAATKAGFKQVYNIAQGFEGDLDPANQRGHLGGWRVANLPWEQD